MPNYTSAELLSESAKVFRAQIEPVKEGGVLNTRQEYAQLLEMAGITFLLYPDSLYYLANLIRNRLLSAVFNESAILEDMLVQLDELGQTGTPVTDTSLVSNARTALLALDAAQSLKNRPELARFLKSMTKFSGSYLGNVRSPSGTLSRPKEDARNLLRENLSRVKDIHTSILSVLRNLRDLADNFAALDLPSAVSATTLASVKSNLDDIETRIQNSTVSENIADSRYVLLKSLASKVAVNVLSVIQEPSKIKIRTPVNPIPSILKHYGRVTGSGDRVYVESSPGPWEIDFDIDHISVAFNDGSYTIPLSVAKGYFLNGKVDGPFNIVAGINDRIHITVDQNQYTSAATLVSLTQATFSTNLALRFKHLGSPICFNSPNTLRPDDYLPRSIVELAQIQTFTISSYNPTTKILVGTSFSGSGFSSEDVGNYVRYGTTYRVEILEVVSSTQARVEVVSGLNPSGSSFLHGYRSTSSCGATFWPAMSDVALSVSVTIGPTTKTAVLAAGSRSVSDVISDIAGYADPNVPYSVLSYHVEAVPELGYTDRISFRSRSWLDPKIYISNLFLSATGPTFQIVQGSAHSTLGFRIGEFGVNRILTPQDLAGLLNDHIYASGVAEVVTTEVCSGTSMYSTEGTSTLSVYATTELSSVQIGDQVEVINGLNALGLYRISAVGSSYVTVRDKTFESSETGLSYRILRSNVRVIPLTSQRRDYIQVSAAPTVLGFSSDMVYALIPYFEGVDKNGNLMSFSGVSVGDTLKVVGLEGVTISEVGTNRLVLSQGLPSNVEKATFSIIGSYAESYESAKNGIDTLLTSGSLLKNHHFDENLDELDYALTSALLPGQGFASTRNQAKLLVADLLSVMTSSPQRTSEYTADIPVSSLHVDDVLKIIESSKIPALDSMIDAFLERKYERAVALLLDGYLKDFFLTNEETGSYSGAILYYSRKVASDLPTESSAAEDIENARDTAVGLNFLSDAQYDYSDTEGQDLSEV